MPKSVAELGAPLLGQLGVAAQPTVGQGVPLGLDGLIDPSVLPTKLIRKVTSTTVANTVTETDLLNGEVTIPGRVMGSNKILRATLWGFYMNNTGANRTFTLRVKFGATTVIGDATDALAASANVRAWRLQVEITNRGVVDSQTVDGFFGLSFPNLMSVAGSGDLTVVDGNTGVFTPAMLPFHNAASEDTTLDKAFAVTVVHSVADANLSMVLRAALIEII